MKAWKERKRNENPPEGQKWCVACKCYKATTYFSRGEDREYVNCKPCRVVNKVYRTENRAELRETRKAREDPVKRRIVTIKTGAIGRGFQWSLADDEASNMINSPCFYCGRQFVEGRINGIDRLDNGGSYVMENCVPCCWSCNNSKGCLDPTTFIERVRILGMLHGKIVTTNDRPELWGTTSSGDYNTYKHVATRKNRAFDFTKERFEEITSMPCTYCHRSNGAHGLDRIDNDIGYIEGNVCSCCRECNYMRGTMSLQEFREVIRLITARADRIRPEIPRNIPVCTKNKIRSRKRKISPADDRDL